MNLQHIKIFQYTAKNDFNLTKVAQALHTSQPGISRQIHELEEELGIELFIRVGKRLIGMTPPGKELLGIANKIMADVQTIQNIPTWFGKNGGGLLRIAANPIAIDAMPPIFVRFCAQYPQVRVTLKQQETLDVLTALLHDEADIGIAGGSLGSSREVITFPCSRSKYMVVVSASHPLADREHLSLEVLGANPLLTYPAGEEERLHVDNAFAGAGITPDIVFTSKTSCLVACARLGMGVAIVCAEEGKSIEQGHGVRVFEADGLFGTAPLLLGIRRGKLMREYERQCVQLLLPHMNPDVVQEAVVSKDSAPYVPNFII